MDIAGFSTGRVSRNGGLGEHDPLPSSLPQQICDLRSWLGCSDAETLPIDRGKLARIANFDLEKSLSPAKRDTARSNLHSGSHSLALCAFLPACHHSCRPLRGAARPSAMALQAASRSFAGSRKRSRLPGWQTRNSAQRTIRKLTRRQVEDRRGYPGFSGGRTGCNGELGEHDPCPHPSPDSFGDRPKSARM